MVLPLDDPNLRYLVTGGTPLGDLERRLRPSFFPESPPSDGVDGMEVKAHAGFADYSRAGFLGHDENLLEVVHRDWEVLVYSESAMNCQQDGTPHRHGIEKVIARRPGETAA